MKKNQIVPLLAVILGNAKKNMKRNSKKFIMKARRRKIVLCLKIDEENSKLGKLN
jgi:hypothetical protein